MHHCPHCGHHSPSSPESFVGAFIGFTRCPACGQMMRTTGHSPENKVWALIFVGATLAPSAAALVAGLSLLAVFWVTFSGFWLALLAARLGEAWFAVPLPKMRIASALQAALVLAFIALALAALIQSPTPG